ncbi:hypothetical protein INS49_001697 [Diaporthe citri]|uniref:uncharacterized protein n=1 Tax=Diaporthe citri TaxID=83186 RepID=UPI001C7EE5F2|nr:uncharacterized protein INS49_001697 [Diaporthe citri]KAG6367507.1 hypothetical protein INS49_001697 [Diaporthe citri]
MKYSAASMLIITTAWTVQAIPTAVPSMGGRARGLPYNAVRSIHSQRRRQESTAAGGTAIPDVTSVLDIPTSDPVLPPTSVGIVTSDPAVITSVGIFPRQDLPPTTTDVVTSEPTAIASDADTPTSEPLPPTTTDVITSEPTAITSDAGVPTSEPLPPTTTDVITSEPVTVPQTFRVKVRQGTVTVIPSQVATPIETVPEVDSPTANPETPIETFPVVDSPTANPETPIETFPVVDSPTANPATPVETFIARSPYTNTATPPTTTG